MILYHGSSVTVEKPDLLHSRPNVDFGRAFYTATIKEQAEKWCNRFRKQGLHAYISTYEWDGQAGKKLKILSFDSYSEEWLDFVLCCRKGLDKTDFDIVTGGVVNDKVFNTVELFFDNLIDKNEAIRRLRYEKPNLQVAFRTEKALSTLRFERSERL